MRLRLKMLPSAMPSPPGAARLGGDAVAVVERDRVALILVDRAVVVGPDRVNSASGASCTPSMSLPASLPALFRPMMLPATVLFRALPENRTPSPRCPRCSSARRSTPRGRPRRCGCPRSRRTWILPAVAQVDQPVEREADEVARDRRAASARSYYDAAVRVGRDDVAFLEVELAVTVGADAVVGGVSFVRRAVDQDAVGPVAQRGPPVASTLMRFVRIVLSSARRRARCR